MLTLTKRLPADPEAVVHFTLALTAEARTRSRHYFETDAGQPLYLNLPRGTVLQHGDLLRTETENCFVRIVAKPEPVLTVTASHSLDLLKAAYHLGNRHVALEVKESYLRLSPDSVLHAMLTQMGLKVQEEIVPFEPETGAYSSGVHHHSHPEPTDPQSVTHPAHE